MDISNILRQLAVSALPILVAISFHEVSHGFVANKLGDPTAKFMGRLTLNPIAHIDPIGTVLMPLVFIIAGYTPFGYAKPVPINPMNFKDPKRDMAISAAAGPITNIILAILSQLILSFILLFYSQSGGISNAVLTPLVLMFEFSILINIVLAVINLIPIPPLDGGRVLVGLLPHKQAVSYSKIEPYGFIIVIILLFTGILFSLISPIISLLYMIVKLF